MKDLVKRLPFIGLLLRNINSKLKRRFKPFVGSEQYWINRYKTGGCSGPGSYNELAEFKAEVINTFVKEMSIQSVIEYGCGDGNQLRYADYPNYLGFDISQNSIELCQEVFSADSTKEFRLVHNYNGESAQLTLSLDVIYHLVEDQVFVDYMSRLFDSAEKYVVIYSSDSDIQRSVQAPHVRHRKFTDWVRINKPEWLLLKQIPNRYPYSGDNKSGSPANYFIFERIQVQVLNSNSDT